ncbi:hypothetical protein [Streptomyces alfalfae]|uniref:Uncharacterized protein n=1 Tax=Streptomyces alfalfae TaxID=1642299 RepID=A0A7T4TYV8_9ACTN|nr:hypothetical protein [Streptomyces alfalfae]QQC89792.1 hypothetical protein I8755_16250 [Streptomyces alfalfae]
MSAAPESQPRDPADPTDPKNRTEPSGRTEAGKPKKPANALVFDDPLSQQSSDDTDRGWGERPSAGGDSAADLARFLDEKPPHHI